MSSSIQSHHGSDHNLNDDVERYFNNNKEWNEEQRAIWTEPLRGTKQSCLSSCWEKLKGKNSHWVCVATILIGIASIIIGIIALHNPSSTLNVIGYTLIGNLFLGLIYLNYKNCKGENNYGIRIN